MNRYLYFLISLMLLVKTGLSLDMKLGANRNLFVVKQIKIQGLRKIEPEAVLEKITTVPGKMLTSYALRSDIKKIHGMQYFENVEAHKEGNDLIFKLKEKRIIRKINFLGNEELSEEDIREKILSKEYNIIDVSQIKSDVSAIEKLYEEKGYYLSQVNYQIENEGEEGAFINFKIREFDKVKVKRITFLGNSGLSSDVLKSFMITKEDSTMSALSDSGNFKDFNFQADIERLGYLYRTKGYLQANIGNPSITVSEDRRWIFITMNINEGPKYSVRNVSFKGDLLFTDQEFLEKIKLKTADIYSEEVLRQDIQVLTELYQDLGYAFVNVLRTLRPAKEDGKSLVDIDYSFEKGKIAYFGRINVNGNTKTRDKVVRRELRIHEGMKFSGSKLRMSKENVNRLGFFEQGSVVFNTVARRNRDNVLDLNISVKERQTGQISVGAGYSTDTRGFLQASIKQNNFRGLGQNLNFNLSLSKVNQNYSLGLTEPYFRDTLWTLGGLVYKSDNANIFSFDYEKQGAEVSVGYPVFDYARAFLTYTIEETEISGVRNSSVDQETENGVASGIELSIVYDRRNNAFEPTKGFYGSAGTEFVGLGFDQRWLQVKFDARFYYPIWKDLILRTRVKSSQLFETSNSRDIPRSEKFSLGGARNMRGYGIEDIGPKANLPNLQRDDKRIEEFNIGGLHSVLATIEFEHPLVREAGLKWAIFYDVGNVYAGHFGDNNDFSLKQNFGFGFRWFSPIGVLRFEFGYPLDREPGQKANQFFFDIGQIF